MKSDKKMKRAATPADEPVAEVKEALIESAPGNRLSCAAAFKAAGRLKRPPLEIGTAADRLGIDIVKCQLGLFGYTPEKKIVAPAPAVTAEMETAIRAKLADGRLGCRQAWDVAETLGVPRMAVSAACESLGVKIKPCQLGAF
jgi:hypothetical protein